MTTKTDLANYALAHLGEPEIADISGTDQVSRLCNRFMDQAIDETLRAHRWNCATKRATLSQLAAAPEHGLDHQYQLPGDFLRLLEVNGEAWEGSDEFFEVETGKVLVTDADEAEVRYIAQIEVSAMDPLLKEVIALKLAAKLAMPRKGRNEVQAQLVQLTRLAMRKAARADAVETKGREGRGIQRILANSPLVRSRFRGRWSQTRFYNKFPTWEG